MPKKNEAPASFETALGELEQIVNRLESGDYLYIQTSESGYDYTLYGPDYKELDGGQLDNPDLSLAEAGKEILAIHERPAGTMEPLTGDRLDDFLEATEQAKNFRDKLEAAGISYHKLLALEEARRDMNDLAHHILLGWENGEGFPHE